jgi:hypothetical protein
MWTPAARAELARESLPYATCLTDTEWTVVAPLMPSPPRDRPTLALAAARGVRWRPLRIAYASGDGRGGRHRAVG